jgi:uncharacterized protein (TIGR03083 family)
MNDADLQPVVATEFVALADLLEPATDEQWDTASLCAGWRVREVIAHMTMAARYPEDKFMAELRRCEFDFGRLSNEIASRDAGLPVGELVANLRSEAMQHWTPPGGGYHGALNHVVIHGLDVTVPLGVSRRSPDHTIRIVLDDLTTGGVHERFGTSVEGRSLQATDLNWSYGSGPALRGKAEDLALILCGRTIPAGRIACGMRGLVRRCWQPESSLGWSGRLASAIAFAAFGSVDWAAVAPLSAGMFAGSMLGPRVTRWMPAAVLRWLIALLGLALAIQLWLHPGA